MKIRKITFQNHELFGDLHLDFTSNGKTVDTVIIAGENGVGKSYLLNTIYDFTNLTPQPQKNEKRIFEIELSKTEMEILRNGENSKQYFTSSYNEINTIFIITIDYNIKSWKQIDIRIKTRNGMSPTLTGHLFYHADTKNALKAIFSDVEINFTPDEIRTVTSTNIDRDDLHSQKSNSNLATDITQLLIDVQSLDALEFSEWGRKNQGKIVDDSKLDLRIRRFTSAFEYMFPTKRYKKIQNVDNHKQIIFEENGIEMPISKLSSGEKQIVFRGSFLLKDKESSKGALILIDEPEISLHPNWQLKILSFFKKLFTDIDGHQTSQIIVSTHSPFILHNANRKDDKAIILQKGADGKIIVPAHPKFYTWSNEEIIQEAFNVKSLSSLNNIFVFLEGETDEKYFNKCLEIFGSPNDLLEFKWIGKINDRGQAENTGDTALNQAKTFFSANPEQIKNKVILLYDSDTNKPEEDVENLLIRKMSTNPNNLIFKIGVENLLNIIPEINVSDFYKERTKTDNYGAVSTLRELDKIKLCNFICDNLSVEQQKNVLEKINSEIKKLK